MVIFHSYVSHYQRVYLPVTENHANLAEVILGVAKFAR